MQCSDTRQAKPSQAVGSDRVGLGGTYPLFCEPHGEPPSHELDRVQPDLRFERLRLGLELDERVTARRTAQVAVMVPHKLLAHNLAERLKQFDQVIPEHKSQHNTPKSLAEADCLITLQRHILCHTLVQATNVQRLLAVFGQELCAGILRVTRATSTSTCQTTPKHASVLHPISAHAHQPHLLTSTALRSETAGLKPTATATTHLLIKRSEKEGNHQKSQEFSSCFVYTVDIRMPYVPVKNVAQPDFGVQTLVLVRPSSRAGWMPGGS
jgi:hypothetical protein